MSASKRLYRVNENRVFLGVSTGLSEYTELDVNLIRVLFVLFAFSGGFSIIIYIVMGIILPIKEVEIRKAETVDGDEYSYNQDDYKV